MNRFTRPGTGWVEVITGSMFSGKSEELIRRVRRAQIARQRVQLFKPRIDNRYDEVRVVSHEGLTADATPVATAEELGSHVLADTHVVGIDEVQFFDAGVLSLAQTLADRGVRVICAGLDQDYRGEPFGIMPSLMAIAEYVTTLHAVCVVCGEPANHTQRLVQSRERVLVGAQNAYEARCRACFDPTLAG